MQAARFTTSGVAAAILDLAVTWLLQIGVGITGTLVARTAGWVCGTLLAYYLNRRWTFGAKASTRRFSLTMVVYGLTYLANIAIYEALFPFFDNRIGLNMNISLVLAFIGAQAVATILNFVIQRAIIFRRS